MSETRVPGSSKSTGFASFSPWKWCHPHLKLIAGGDPLPLLAEEEGPGRWIPWIPYFSWIIHDLDDNQQSKHSPLVI